MGAVVGAVVKLMELAKARLKGVSVCMSLRHVNLMARAPPMMCCTMQVEIVVGGFSAWN